MMASRRHWRCGAGVLVHQERGVALVMVLGVIVLILALAVGFLMRVSLERNAAQSYRAATEARTLADTVVSIVQAQIHHASTAEVDGGPAAWASQPGMVRSFAPDGSLSRAYKLYSDDEMVVGTLDPAGMIADLATWRADTAHFTDLNAPVRSNYPILDPSAAGSVEGFRVEAAPGVTTAQPVPMPVRWLYVLKDGQVKAPTGSGAVAVIAGATQDNPVVGRVAFWTDDETAKLNINTASHGGFWDLPRAFTFEERDRMARFQPALREFQRYPGHPATTSLFPVLGYKFGGNEQAFADALYGSGNDPGLSPRVQAGGSLNGTVKAVDSVDLDDARLYSSVDEMIFKPDRADNGAFDRSDLEKAKFFLTAHSRAPEVNLFHLPRIVAWPVNAGVKRSSALDKLIAFCGTISDVPYYLKRADPDSGSADYLAQSSNQNLAGYLRSLMQRDIPGFGSVSFADKWTQAEADQIRTELFDYIRSSNIFCTTLDADPFTPSVPPSGNARTAVAVKSSRAGQVTPMEIGDTKGFGRLPVLSKAMLQFFTSGASDSGGNALIPQIAPFADTPRLASTPEMALPPIGETVQFQTRAVVYFDTFDASYGYPYPRYNFDLEVSFSGPWTVTRTGGPPLNLSFAQNPAALPIRHDPLQAYDSKTASAGGGNFNYSVWFGRYLGGPQGPLWLMQNFNAGFGPGAGQYPLVTAPFNLLPPIATVSDNGTPPAPALPDPAASTETFSFSGGSATVRLKVGTQVVQTYEFEFPGFANKPAPLYPGPQRGDVTPTVQGVVQHTQLQQAVISADFRHRLVGGVGWHREAHATLDGYDYCDLRLVQPYDVVVALEPAYGDKRLIGGRKILRTAASYTSGTPARSGGEVATFVPHENYFDTVRHAHSLRTAPFNTEALPGPTETRPGRILDIVYGRNASPDVPTRYHGGVPTLTPAGADGGFPPDFDNGTLHMPDDAYVNRADEGSSEDALTGTGETSSGDSGRQFAWYSDSFANYQANVPTFYSPSKQMPSAAMFGSLPTGVVRDLPWQTLLFRPDPGGHPGADDPPDYLLLDLFWMPVVEPYALSEPFSTAGKVNMNYQIVPFTYLKRESAIRGLLHSQELVTIADTEAYRGSVAGPFGAMDEYKMFNAGNASSFSSKSYRAKLNVSETLKGFEKRFDDGRLFISETEICTLPLIPDGSSYSDDFEGSYWSARRLTGDNSREMPYVQLLPRVTTKSNTYTIHYRVQALRQKPGRAVSEWSEWREGSDLVTAEYRGSSTIERYVDPNNPDIPDYAADPAALPGLDAFYRWRTIGTRQFAP